MADLLIPKYPQAVNFSLNPIPVKIFKNDVDVNVIVVRLLVETTYLSGTYVDSGLFFSHPDADGFGFHDFGGSKAEESILHSFFSGYDFPSYDQDTITEFSQSIRRFKLEYNYYNPAGTLFNVSTSNVFHVVMGGVQWQEFPSAGYWHYFQPDTPAFLTWCPNNKYVSTAQQEYLAYMPLDSPGVVRRYIKIYYTDGTDEIQHDAGTALTQYRIYLFPAGYDQLDIQTFATAAGKTVLKYDVWLGSISTDICGIRTYIIDRSYQPNERFFIFKNSVGGIDVLRTTGVGARGLSHEQTIIHRSTDYRYKVADGQRSAQNIAEQETQKVHSGFRSFQEADFYREMLLSPVIYEAVRDRWTPIEIIRKSFDIYRDDDDLFHVYFEYNYRFVNSVYGNAKINAIPSNLSEATDNADFPH